jgi:hypothetical protein
MHLVPQSTVSLDVPYDSILKFEQILQFMIDKAQRGKLSSDETGQLRCWERAIACTWMTCALEILEQIN